MLRLLIFILAVLLCFCNRRNKSNPESRSGNSNQTIKDTTNNEYKLTTRFNSFDTTVEVLFRDTKDAISDIQKKNYEGFIAKQGILTPEILKKNFDYYKKSYPDYKSGWTITGKISDKELEKYLPLPTTPENLKPFITPAIVHIQSRQDCKEGTLGIEFDCTWDIENGLGVSIRNWKVIEASVAEISYL